MYEGMYTDLSSRYSDASLAESSAMPDITILDRAAPANGVVRFATEDHRRGHSPRPRLGLGLSVMLDRLDTSSVTWRRSHSGARVPGTVPMIAQPPRRAKPEDAAE